MNSKITFPELVTLLANSSGVDKALAESFLKELFGLIASSLEAGEPIKIKGLGTFKLISVESRKSVDVNSGKEIEIPEHKRVSFVPAKDLAAQVNAPFEAFEAFELSDNLSDDELAAIESESDDIEIPTNNEAQTISPEIETLVCEEPTPPAIPVEAATETLNETKTEVVVEAEADNTSEIAETLEIVDETANSNSEEVTETGTEIEIDTNTETETTQKTSPRFGWGFLSGFAAAVVLILIAGGVWWFTQQSPNAERQKETNTIAKATATATANTETAQIAEPQQTPPAIEETSVVEEESLAPPTQPSDTKPVYDTITKSRYLTTMAKDHYGNYHLWPYIYEENKSKLGHPDRIRPGTQVIVPPLSKYGVNPHSEADIEKAKRKGAEIYKKWEGK
jgi:nucleoid DNA-binding protein